MKVYLATDHAGFEMKEKAKAFLARKGYEIEDCGAYEFDKNDDYPDFIKLAAEKVSEDPDNTKAIIFGGSGQGEAIVANKFKGVRAAVFYTPAKAQGFADATGRTSEDPFEMICLVREHNDANVLSFGARFLKEEDMYQAIELFFQTPFSQDERHRRRIEKIKMLEDGR